MKISKYSIVAIIIVVILLIISIKIIISNNKKLFEINNLYNVAQDSVKVYRNSFGQQVSKSEVLQTTNQKYFLELKSKDSTIIQLQKLLKQETKKRHDIEVAIIFKDQTISKLQDSICNTIVDQTYEHKGDSVFIYPVYSKIISNKWEYENIKIGKNIFDRSLITKNEYNIVVGDEPDGWFKRKQFAEITNLNPNSETTTLKVYQKKEVKNKTLWTSVKVGVIGLIVGLIIK